MEKTNIKCTVCKLDLYQESSGCKNLDYGNYEGKEDMLIAESSYKYLIKEKKGLIFKRTVSRISDEVIYICRYCELGIDIYSSEIGARDEQMARLISYKLIGVEMAMMTTLSWKKDVGGFEEDFDQNNEILYKTEPDSEYGSYYYSYSIIGMDRKSDNWTRDYEKDIDKLTNIIIHETKTVRKFVKSFYTYLKNENFEVCGWGAILNKEK